LTCLAHVLEPSLCRLLTARHLSSADDSPFRLEFFNLYEQAAQVLLARHPPFDDDHATGPPDRTWWWSASASSANTCCSRRRDDGGRC
jgi:hypothetical protein